MISPNSCKAVQVVGKAAKSALSADGLTIQQFNESAGGQVVFHIHFHVIPRFDGVPLKPHTGQMEKPEVLAERREDPRRSAGGLNAAGEPAQIAAAVCPRHQSAQSSERATALSQSAFRRSRREASMAGVQRLSTAQLRTSSSVPAQKPVARPAA